MSEEAREILELDVVFVGAGPASMAGAYHLGRLVQQHNETAEKALEVEIAILEKGKEVGSHALSGAVVDPRALKELFPEDWQSAPFEGEVASDKLWWMTRGKAFPMPVPPMLNNSGKYVASLGKLLKWMESKLEDVGVDVFCEFPATQALFDGDRVIGVRTGDKGVDEHGEQKANYEPGVDIHANAVVLGEGPRGTLAKQLESKLNLGDGKNPQIYAIGIKEVWDLPPGRIKAGEVIHTMNWPLGFSTFGGGFIYGMKDDQLIVGLVVGLDYKNPLLDPHEEFQRFKTHPRLRALLEGGKMAFYGAKALPEGGWWSMPKLSGDGFVLCGDSGGFLNSQRLKGIHLAMKSGMLAAETIFEGLVQGEVSATCLEGYQQRVDESWIKKELFPVRNFHQAFDKGLLAGMVQAGLGMVTGGRGWGFKDRLTTEAGHERLQRLDQPGAPPEPQRLAFDGQLTFDKLSDLYNSGTSHEEDQPVHLLVEDTNICVDRCAKEFGNPCQHFCPAQVYEMVEDESTASGKRLQINASNCVHCKTCDVMDPYQIITWVPPEGGGGPNYSKM
ncbi:MAG: electron transfer flavoprotein-ubiquinone oxidoreductase [Deltaproteobacteria bacterium]|nr:electron transfer flavoprotein-ubiquinone oxidoreductase [Deltaproteobacteria bacterium]